MTGQRVREFMSHKTCGQKMPNNGNSNVFAYPQNDVRELARIMMDIRIDCMPVLSSPWDKKLIGFIELNKIKTFLKE